MSKNTNSNSSPVAATLVALAAGLMLAGCGQKPATPEATPAEDAAAMEAAARDAEMKAKEDELAQRETDLAAKADEQQAALDKAHAETAAAKSAAAKATAALPKAAPVVAKPIPAVPVETTLTVPAGTNITVALINELSSKTAKANDRFQTRLTSDLMVGDKVVAKANSRVTGMITDVVSGSNKIGGVPMLGLTLDRLVLSDGQRIQINGELVEQGKSDTARDTAKILGGTAAGAILGHQVKKGSGGKVIGGLLGGAIGAVAAKKTGTEVTIPAGSTLTISTGAPFNVKVMTTPTP
jgi:hypothetical protein